MDATEASWWGLLEHARQMEPDPELADLDDDQLEAQVRDGAARIAAMTCRWLGHVAELVVRGRERFAAGTISYSKVRAITRVATPEAEDDLLHLADSAPASQLEQIIAGCRRQMSEQEMWARGPEADPAELNDRADAGHQPPLHTDIADDGAGGEPAARAPIGVRRAVAVTDALATAVAVAAPDRSGADEHVVVLHVDVDQLAAATCEGDQDVEADPSAEAGASAEAAQQRTSGPSTTGRRHVVTGRGRAMHVPNSVLAELTCDTELRLAGIHDHDGHGHPADIGRTSRKVPADLRRALQLRDRHCRFPGCHRTRQLHAHHVVHWARGGPTDLANLLLVCAFHHRVIHRQHWTLRPVDPLVGRWTFHAPDQNDPHPPVLPLPGASAETAADIIDAPHPMSLQPPWWDGNVYDLNETIAVVVDALRDIRPPHVERRTHPAMAAQAAA